MQTSFNREPGLTYIGIPSGSLNTKTVELLEKADFLRGKLGRNYEVPSAVSDLIFRVLDRKELAAQVAMGVVDAGITGKDYIFETGQTDEVEVVSDFIFSKTSNQPSRLVLASDPKDISNIEACRGKRIATELPRLTRFRLQQLFGFSEADLRLIIPSEGKTEAKVRFGIADAFTDITETGNTLKANGFKEIETIFKSNPQLIANGEALKNSNTRDLIERLAIGVGAVLDAEKEPKYLVIMNVPKARLEEVLRFLPSSKSPTIKETGSPDWVALEAVISVGDFQCVAQQLTQIGVDNIIPTPIEVFYNQSLRNGLYPTNS